MVDDTASMPVVANLCTLVELIIMARDTNRYATFALASNSVASDINLVI